MGKLLGMKMTKKLITLFSCLVLLSFSPGAKVLANECKKFAWKVKLAHEWFFGIDYPYWFSLAQLKVESGCRWRTSLDGLGSIGYAQITAKYWDKELSRFFPNWKKKQAIDYFLAQAYILEKFHRLNKYKKLFITYQCYNGRCRKILKEVLPDKSWRTGYQNCLKHKRKVCVWRKHGKCLQYRYDCDINYSYSLKIYKLGKSLEEWETRRWKFW